MFRIMYILYGSKFIPVNIQKFYTESIYLMVAVKRCKQDVYIFFACIILSIVYVHALKISVICPMSWVVTEY